MNPRYELARKIVEMTADYEAGKLKRSARDFISGMVKAYQIIIGTVSVDVAYDVAKVEARLATSRNGESEAWADDDPIQFDEAGDQRWQETLAGN